MYIDRTTIRFHKSGSVHVGFSSTKKTYQGIKTVVWFEIPEEADLSVEIRKAFTSFDVKRLAESIKGRFLHPCLGEFLEKDLVVEQCFWAEDVIHVSLIRGVDLSLALSPEQVEDVFGGGEDKTKDRVIVPPTDWL